VNGLIWWLTRWRLINEGGESELGDVVVGVNKSEKRSSGSVIVASKVVGPGGFGVEFDFHL
jgi:hypothetical protein